MVCQCTEHRFPGRLQLPDTAQLTRRVIPGAAQLAKLQPPDGCTADQPRQLRVRAHVKSEPCQVQPQQQYSRRLQRTSGFSGSFISLARRSRLARSGALAGRYSSIRFCTIRPACRQSIHELLLGTQCPTGLYLGALRCQEWCPFPVAEPTDTCKLHTNRHLALWAPPP